MVVKPYLILCFVVFCFCLAHGQDSLTYSNHNVVFGTTLGLNNPYAKAYNGQNTTTLVDPNGNVLSQTQQTITSNTLVPPLQIYTDWFITPKWSIGISGMIALHQQNYTITNLQTNTVIGNSREALFSFYALATTKYVWVIWPKMQLGSGIGLGYTFGQTGQKTPVPPNHLAVALQPIFLRYLICCGWHLQADISFYNSPAGENLVDNRGGYNVGLGVVYVLQPSAKKDLP